MRTVAEGALYTGPRTSPSIMITLSPEIKPLGYLCLTIPFHRKNWRMNLGCNRRNRNQSVVLQYRTIQKYLLLFVFVHVNAALAMYTESYLHWYAGLKIELSFHCASKPCAFSASSVGHISSYHLLHTGCSVSKLYK